MNEIITIEKFVSYINYIQFRLTLIDDDSGHKEIKAIIKKIRKSFPIDEQGFCAIEFFCFFENFGKHSNESEVTETPEQLYYRLLELNSKHIINKSSN